MNIIEVVKNIKNIALLQPNIKTVTDGSIDVVMNENPSIEYGVFHLTQTTHKNVDNWDWYSFNFFVVDRLTEDGSNKLLIQSNAKDTLKNIIETFVDTYDAEHDEIVYQPFTERFKDECAGVYCSVTVKMIEDYGCAINYTDGSYTPLILLNQSLVVTENGVYEPEDGYTGFDKVEVAIPIEGVMHRTITDNGQYEITPDYGVAIEAVNVDVAIPIEQDRNDYIGWNGVYKIEPTNDNKALKDVTVNVDIPIQSAPYYEFNGSGSYTLTAPDGFAGMNNIDVSFTAPIADGRRENADANGLYYFDVPEGYEGQKAIEVIVDVPVPQIEETKYVNLVPDSTGVIKPSNEYDAIAKVEYRVSSGADVKMKIPNGITFSGSTFTEFDANKYDWSMVYDCYELFRNCSKVTSITGMDYLKPLNMERMFYDCANLQNLDFMSNWDVSKLCELYSSFYNCRVIENLDGLSNWNTNKLISMYSTFCNCYELKNIDGIKNWDVSNVENMESTFQQCSSLLDVNGLNWNTSKVTNMKDMFYRCSTLTNVDISNLDVSNVINMTGMFQLCTNLVSVKFGGAINSNVKVTDMFYGNTKTGTLYYPEGYDYTTIINVLPNGWTAVAY